MKIFRITRKWIQKTMLISNIRAEVFRNENLYENTLFRYKKNKRLLKRGALVNYDEIYHQKDTLEEIEARNYVLDRREERIIKTWANR